VEALIKAGAAVNLENNVSYFQLVIGGMMLVP
jgi:hypothetical protein